VRATYVSIAAPGEAQLEFTGERFTPERDGPIAHEHLHRYLFALQFCAGKDVLDIASGEGYGAFVLARVARRADGVDLSPEAVRHAVARYRRENLTYRQGSCTEIPIADASVDVVVSFETIEHFTEHERFLAEIRRVLRPGGVLIISSPDRVTYSPPGKPANPYHVRELTSDEFKRLVDSHFEHVEFGGQKATAGSLILPDGDDPAALECFSSAEPGSFSQQATIARPLYVIAVASSGPLPSFRWGVLEDDGYVPALTERMQILDGELGRLAEKEQRAVALEKVVAGQEQRIADQLLAIETLSAQLGKALAAPRSREDLERLRGEVQALQRSLDAVVTSRSWRMTRPLRDVAALARASRRGGSSKALVWNLGKLAVAMLPPKPREALRAAKRKVLRAAGGGDSPGLDRPQLDEPRVAVAIKSALATLAAARSRGEGFTHLVVVPFLKSGGADLTAANYLRFLSEARGPECCLLILADSPDVTVPDWIPTGVAVLRLDDHIEAPSARERVDLLHALVLGTGARVVHNVNSVAGWNLFIHRGRELSARARLFGSIFAFQYGPAGELIGYAAEFFERARPHLAGLLTDNARFAQDLATTYALDDEWRRRIHVIYNPCRALAIAPPPQRQRAPGAALRVLWAGRVDAEKLPDVLQSVADRATYATFDVFGGTVVDARGPMLRPSERLRLRGSFASIEELLAHGPYDAFLFTSKWEGMPNVLLEIGVLGIPVIAPDVGGVPELVHEGTGYLVRGARNIEGYLEALDAIRHDPDAALERARNLATLVRERHAWSRFSASLRDVPDYA
jgi:glycosyltransferase involved in cell wall biosynthesis/SAM-dependent methyltransferase